MFDARKTCLGLMLSVLLGSGVYAFEDDGESKTEQADAATIDQLVQDLESKDFATREAATKELNRLGKAVAPAVTKTALGKNREASGRAFGILKKLFQSKDADTKAAAKKGLEEIADANVPGVSQQAARVLEPPKPVQQRGVGAQVRVQFQIGGGAGRRITVRTVNGVKEIDAEENGQKVHIEDGPQNGIKMKVTKKNAEGKEETKNYEAKNADDLKKKHPDAHKLYEKYSKGGGINVIQVGIPQRFNAFGRVPVAQINELEGKVADVMKRLGKAAEADDPSTEIAESLKLLEQIQEQLKKLRSRPGLQLRPAAAPEKK